MEFNNVEREEFSNVVSNVRVFGLSESILGSGYPMKTDVYKLEEFITAEAELDKAIINKDYDNKQLKRATKLGGAERGAGHDTFLNGVIVQFDLTFTNKAWVEAERYHFLDFVSSQSTMHRIAKFDLDNAYIKYVDPRMIQIMKEKVADYNMALKLPVTDDLDSTIERDKLLKTKYLEILYSNPAGFKITARMTTNYRQLKTIYYQRKDHRLVDEWGVFCKWIETLPMMDKLLQLGE